MIKIDFERGEPPLVFRDALWLQDDHGLTDIEIEAMKDERYANWLAIINAPPVEAPQDFIEIDGVRYVKAG